MPRLKALIESMRAHRVHNVMLKMESSMAEYWKTLITLGMWLIIANHMI